MAAYENLWGPEIQHYSHSFDLNEFEPSGDLSDPHSSGVWKDMNMIPRSLLETSLSRSDLKKGYCYGNRPLATLLSTLENYHKAYNGRVSVMVIR